ncbi:TPA: AraC family transcriptional regulator [Enterobacter roggenkampii]|nr:AraC family transcriptional regulator [Enterobacter roggenkampii]
MTQKTKNFAHTPVLTDALSDILTSVRFSGGYIEAYDSDVHSGASFDMKERSMLIVRKGTLLFQCDAVGSEPIKLCEGDIVLLAYGSNFSISYPPNFSEKSEWLRGTFHLDAKLSERLLGCMPKVILLSEVAHAAMDWMETASHFILSEIQSPGPGGKVMISRLMELMFIRVLRIWALEPSADASWLQGANDPAIARALSAIHTMPEKAWTVPELAKAAGLSRSVFAERFSNLVGLPPSRYLIGLRLDKAAELLLNTKRSIVQIAEHTGYTSEASFSRAFKLRFGYSPSRWRKQN